MASSALPRGSPSRSQASWTRRCDRSAGAEVEVVSWVEDTEVAEVDRIAESIHRLHDVGLPYRDVAVLVRIRAANPELLRAFDDRGIPVQPAGRTGLFERAEARLLGKSYSWLADHDWSPQPRQRGAVPTDREVLEEFAALFALSPDQRAGLARRLGRWKAGWSPRTGRSTWSPTSTPCSPTSASGGGTTTTR